MIGRVVVEQDDFDDFVNRNSGALHNLALSLTGSVADADDLLQETLVRVMRNWRRQAPDFPLAYARQALIRTHISDRRRARWRWERSAPPDQVQASEAPSDEMTRDELLGALAELAPRQRQAVVLRYLEELSVAETARLMRCSEGNVKRCAYEGLKHLRARLGGEVPNREGTQEVVNP